MKTLFKILIGLVIVSISIGVIYIRTADCRNQDNLINRLQCKLHDKNTIEIRDNSFEINDLEIRLYSGDIVFQSGKKIAEIPREYGRIDFLIYYSDNLIGQAGINNRNWWQTHDFIFDFSAQEIINFKFKVNGPDSETLYYKHFTYDSLKRIQAEIFYNNLGLTGQINRNYFNQSKNLIAEEVWLNDTLITLNVYDNNNFLKNFNVQKYGKDIKCKLCKIDITGFLAYDLTIIKADTTFRERIIIKN
jgi:hypothetical protein